MQSDHQTRREFCIRACQAASVMAFGGAVSAILQSCSSDDPLSSGSQNLPQIQATAVNGVITLTIDAGSPLAAVGSAAQVQHASGTLLVARTAQNEFTALTAVCTKSTPAPATARNSTPTVKSHAARPPPRCGSMPRNSPTINCRLRCKRRIEQNHFAFQLKAHGIV